MDKLIAEIGRGVGAKKRKRGRSPVLVRLASNRISDHLLDSGDDSSDEDYTPDSGASELTHLMDTKNARKKPQKRRKSKVGEMQEKTTPDALSSTSAISDKAWSVYISDEILLKIFHHAIIDAQPRLQFLMRLSKVCRLWKRISYDPSLWRSLDLSYGWIKCPRKALACLESRQCLSQLTHLNLSSCNKVDLSLIQVIATKYERLKSLNLSDCQKLSVEGLRVVAGGFKELQHINLSGLINSSSRCQAVVDIIKAHEKTLLKLELSSTRRTPGLGIVWCLTPLTSLTVLDISGTVLPAAPQVMNILKGIASSVQVLRISRCIVAASLFDQQALMLLYQELSYPELVEFTAAEADLSQLLPLSCFTKGASKLKHLDVRGWSSSDLSYLNEDGLSDVFPVLQSLNLRNVEVVRNIPLYLAKFASSLEQLDISWMKGISKQADTFSSHIEGLLTPESRLAAFYCAGMPLSMQQLRKLLANLSQLCTLDLESCRSIDRGLKRRYDSKQQVISLKKDLLC